MNDTTSLSSNYSLTSTFAKEFNEAVLLLKRRYLTQGALPAPAAEDEAAARTRLAGYLRSVIWQLAPEQATGARPAERAPEAIVSRLTDKNQSKMAWLVADLRQAERAIGEAAPLGEDEFAALDEVCDAADATASASFRRLWRR
jgi:hypothetical protein